MSKVATVKDQSVAELQEQRKELSKKIFQIRNELNSAHKLDKPHLLRKAKRDRARILTVLNQKGKQS